MARAVLWDMDGTLVDSREQHWEAWRRTIEPEGYSVTYQQFLGTFGWRNDAILGRWLGGKLSAAEVRRIGDAKEALVERFFAADTAAADVRVEGPYGVWTLALDSHAKEFAGPGENVDESYNGFHIVGGGEYLPLRWLGIGAELAWSSVPDARPIGRVSEAFDESNLGCTTLRVKVVVGR